MGAVVLDNGSVRSLTLTYVTPGGLTQTVTIAPYVGRELVDARIGINFGVRETTPPFSSFATFANDGTITLDLSASGRLSQLPEPVTALETAVREWSTRRLDSEAIAAVLAALPDREPT